MEQKPKRKPETAQITGRGTNLPTYSPDLIRSAIGRLSAKNNRRYRTRNIRSVMLLDAGTRDFEFFANREVSAVSKYANYPNSVISTPTGMIVKVTAEILDADLKPVNFAGGTTPYAKYYEVKRLINSFEFSYHKDNTKRKDFSLSEAHKPLFTLIEAGKIGTPADTTLEATVIQEKENEGVLLLSELIKTSSVSIKSVLPTGAPAISSDLADHLLVLTALIAEEDIG